MSLPHAVLVTGGARRLGAAMALACATAGMDVALHYRTDGQDVADMLNALHSKGVKAAAIAADLADPAQVPDVVPTAAMALGRPLTALVNSASIFDWDDISTLTADRMLAHFLPNTVAPALLSQALLAQLPDGVTGSIVNILDQKLASPHGDHLSYTLSKYALMGLGEVLARSGAPRLRVNAIAPGYVLPAPGQEQAEFERLHAQNPLHVGPDADDIARACLYLLQSAVTTGQTLYVDAGLRFAGLEKDISFY
ncbi:SDR family oxidoreductase [Niveispirillum sp.]|uniref:SDR family oxidoreductase n=1 Tax=Niveispirillum sp. TaxID=1917217 RepID=UPI001B7302CC|nr:SDR family oxidoreductase [Niveispirillum sp.]MBP7337186.1 SDR family oxidoreductase [Niveispirillum sp.]